MSVAKPPSRKPPRTSAPDPDQDSSPFHQALCPVETPGSPTSPNPTAAHTPLLATVGPTALNRPQFRRALAVHLYCYYRLDNFSNVTARKLASSHQPVAQAYERRQSIQAGRELLSSSMDKMREWLREQPRGTAKPLAFARWVSSAILVPKFGADAMTSLAMQTRGPSSMSIRTAKRWLRALGWVYGTDTKGAYTDSTCRDDVIAARNAFISAMDASATCTCKVEESYMTRAEFDALDKCALATIVTDAVGHEVVCGKSCKRCAGGKHLQMSRMVDPDLATRTCLLLPVYHDECTFMANDGKTVFWMPRWSHSLEKKSRGKGNMISSFVCECHGELRIAVPMSYIAQLKLNHTCLMFSHPYMYLPIGRQR
ncbi:hypothetical protein BCR44DRAFT_1510992 [Catenaria anguillulae PL171]|uniref:Uncharacterized protein n=1 Tax=Catenaria anguillulae PL171 TaxID=765915 RepID=A0A1Y2HVW0_9FUNG|nr:hypothetical protein BCR44DRAFT_1510992 [Catenaria anguillulae PL171]